MIAALQMYSWPEVRPATEAYWAEVLSVLRDAGVGGPSTLTWVDDFSDPWQAPDLLLGQTCGLPFVHGRCGTAVVVGRPDYGIEGADGGFYRSALIARAETKGGLSAFRGQRAAVNEMISQSGCNALAATLVREGLASAKASTAPFFGEVTLSHAHRRSAEMVADGQADLAAIDAVAWALFGLLDPMRWARLRVVTWSDPVPALPFITSAAYVGMASALADSLNQAAEAVWAVSDELPPGIPKHVRRTDASDYQPIRDLAAELQGLRLSKDAPPLLTIR